MSAFHLQIVTPDGSFFDAEAEKLIVRAIDGDICILPKHIPYVTALSMGEARVTVDGQVRYAAANGGMLAVTGDKVRLVASTFEWAEDIDKERAKRAHDSAKETMQSTKDAKEIQMAKARLTRALVRLKVAEK